MIVKNRRTKETLEMSYSTFRKRFTKDIQVSFDSYKQTQLNQSFYKFEDDNLMESNFYFQIQYNFNNFGNSAWYIEKL